MLNFTATLCVPKVTLYTVEGYYGDTESSSNSWKSLLENGRLLATVIVYIGSMKDLG